MQADQCICYNDRSVEDHKSTIRMCSAPTGGGVPDVAEALTLKYTIKSY